MTNKAVAPSQLVPSAEDLSKVERDLRFHPSKNESPAVLTTEQISAFNRDGYLAGIRIFTDEEITGIRHYFDELLARTIAAGGDSYSITTAHLKHRRVYDILTDPRIVSRIEDLLGENVVAWARIFSAKCRATANACPGIRIQAIGHSRPRWP